MKVIAELPMIQDDARIGVFSNIPMLRGVYVLYWDKKFRVG